MKNPFEAKWFRLATTAWLLALTALAPLKFSSLVGVPEADPTAPRAALEWLLMVWPSMLFAVASGIGLLMALATCFPRYAAWRSRLWLNAGLWSLVALTSVMGVIHATNVDLPFSELTHLFGAAAYVLAITLMLTTEPRFARKLLMALGVALALIVASGLYQYFFGFEEMRHFVEAEEAKNGPYPPEYRARLLDTRISGGFTAANSLAGVLLLLVPVALAAVWRWAKQFEPARVSQWLMTGVAAAAAIGVYLGTKSRAAFLALTVAVVVYGFLRIPSRKWRIAILIAAVATVVAGGYYIHYAGRGFGSMTVRGDYYVVGAKLLAEKPLTGAGWGEFFHRYLALKVFDIDEASHDPHSMVMTIASQCGMLGLFAIVGAIGFVLFTGYKICRNGQGGTLHWAMWFGLLCFYLHGLVELHLQSVGTLIPSLALGAILLTPKERRESDGNLTAAALFSIASVVIAVGCIWAGSVWVRGEYAYSNLIATLSSRSSGPLAIDKAYQEVSNLRPHSPYPAQQMGEYYFRLGRWAQAEPYFLLALERAPERSMYFGRLAEIYARLNRKAESARFAREALKRSPAEEKYRRFLPDENL